MYADLLRRLAPTYRPAGYDAMTAEQQGAWHAAHDALRAADGVARDAEVRLDRARARSSTTPAHLDAVVAQVEASDAARWVAFDALIALEGEPAAELAA